MKNLNYEKLIGQWHRNRNLIDGSTDKDQYMKLIQEAGELSDSIDDQILSCVIKAEVMPNDESPVFSGNTLWKISASQSNGSKVYYKSEFTADIFLPPFFGESIFKKTINRNLDFLENSLNNFYF